MESEWVECESEWLTCPNEISIHRLMGHIFHAINFNLFFIKVYFLTLLSEYNSFSGEQIFLYGSGLESNGIGTPKLIK